MDFPRKYPPEATFHHIRLWCDQAERSHFDVRNKLTRWGVPLSEREDLISELISLDLINETRYAEAFANDHFQFRNWGKKKIESALRSKGISAANISRALLRIPAEDAMKTMMELLEKKAYQFNGLQEYQKRIKATRYLLGKGYTSEQASSAVNSFYTKADDDEKDGF